MGTVISKYKPKDKIQMIIGSTIVMIWVEWFRTTSSN